MVSEGSKEVANIAVIIINPSLLQTWTASDSGHESVLHWALPQTRSVSVTSSANYLLI